MRVKNMRPKSSVVSYSRPGLPRIVELAIAVPVLVLVAPIVALAALAIVVTSRGPAFFRQERVGLGGRTFLLIKLRTMRTSNEGPLVTAADDARITAVGKFLRVAKIDELPQLWNVVKGEMSLVGPRPEVQKYVDPKNGLWQVILQSKPGIADPV